MFVSSLNYYIILLLPSPSLPHYPLPPHFLTTPLPLTPSLSPLPLTPSLPHYPLPLSAHRMAAREQEKRDYELALRLSQVHVYMYVYYYIVPFYINFSQVVLLVDTVEHQFLPLFYKYEYSLQLQT